MTTADSELLIFSLSETHTAFLLTSRQRTSHADGTWKTRRSKCGGAPTTKKKTLHAKEEKNPDENIGKYFPHRPKSLTYPFYLSAASWRCRSYFWPPRSTQATSPSSSSFCLRVGRWSPAASPLLAAFPDTPALAALKCLFCNKEQ